VYKRQDIDCCKS